ncbi:MAG: hypothetical protein IT357_07755 [Gemmatimonadaceae bacterium]|nr:hypothetical protein [Gemmatimonadaceae bacterium]
MLPAVDLQFLQEKSVLFEVLSESNMTCVLLKDYELPPGFDRDRADLLLRLSPGYPDVPPDMWWFKPPVLLAGGTKAQATDLMETYLGSSWQRWSRHLEQGQWRSGCDGLEGFLAVVRGSLEQAVRG